MIEITGQGLTIEQLEAVARRRRLSRPCPMTSAHAGQL